jgi:phytoene/squalene synthetase
LVGQSGLAFTAGDASDEPSVAADAARTVRRVSFMGPPFQALCAAMDVPAHDERDDSALDLT